MTTDHRYTKVFFEIQKIFFWVAAFVASHIDLFASSVYDGGQSQPMGKIHARLIYLRVLKKSWTDKHIYVGRSLLRQVPCHFCTHSVVESAIFEANYGR